MPTNSYSHWPSMWKAAKATTIFLLAAITAFGPQILGNWKDMTLGALLVYMLTHLGDFLKKKWGLDI